IITDVINLELFLGIMYAGLNFRAHQNRYSSSPHQARESVDDLLVDPSDPRPNNGPTPSDDDAHRQGFMDDVLTQLPPDATPQKILSATQDKLDEEINDRKSTPSPWTADSCPKLRWTAWTLVLATSDYTMFISHTYVLLAGWIHQCTGYRYLVVHRLNFALH